MKAPVEVVTTEGVEGIPPDKEPIDEGVVKAVEALKEGVMGGEGRGFLPE